MLAGAAGDAMALAGEASDTSGTRWPGGQSRPARLREPASTREEPTSKLRSTPEEASNMSTHTRAHPASAGWKVGAATYEYLVIHIGRYDNVKTKSGPRRRAYRRFVKIKKTIL